MSLLRRRAFMAVSKKEAESPYAFSFNIVTTDNIYEANAEDLAILNKGLSIIIELAGGTLNGFNINQDTAPQEFDLRINGVRDFNFNFWDYNNSIIDCYLAFNDGVSIYFGTEGLKASNPIFESFKLYKA